MKSFLAFASREDFFEHNHVQRVISGNFTKNQHLPSTRFCVLPSAVMMSNSQQIPWNRREP